MRKTQAAPKSMGGEEKEPVAEGEDAEKHSAGGLVPVQRLDYRKRDVNRVQLINLIQSHKDEGEP